MSTAYAFTNWAKGELSPQARGRVDVAQYYSSAKTINNCLIRPYGNLVNRAGSRFVAEVKDSTKATRLLKFVFSVTEAYIIEFGENYFRFYTNNGQVQVSGAAYEVAHTYSESELFDVHFAQKNDVIYLAHPNHAPATLTRTSSTSWTLADFDFLGGPLQDCNKGTCTMSASSSTGSTTLTSSEAGFFTADMVGGIIRVKDGTVKITSFTSGTEVDGEVQKLSDGTDGDLNVGAAATTDWSYGAWSGEWGWPATVTFHESRLCWARSTDEPQKVWMSKSFIYNDYVPGTNDDDPISFELNTEQANDIKWISSSGSLAVGTFGGEFIVSPGNVGEALTPSNVNAKRQTGWGSENIAPKKISNFTYYVQRGSRKVRELFYFWDLDNYKSVDMTILAEHITLSGIVDMDYQQNPDSWLWCVKENGDIAVFTRDTDQEIQAWSSVSTDGNYEAVAVIPEPDGEYDQAWTIVNRTIEGNTKRFIEYFDNHIVDENTLQYKCFYVDSGLTYDAYDLTDGISLTISAATGTVTATSGAAYFSSDMVGKRIRTLDTDGNTAGELKITQFDSSTQVTGTVRLEFPDLTVDGGSWGVSVDQVSGLSHLALEEVAILADGGVENNDTRKTVSSSGYVDLDSDFFYISIGLPYSSYMETNPIEADAMNGTAQGKIKRIFEVAIKVYRTLGILIGSSLDDLDAVQFRNPSTLMGEPEALVTGDVTNVVFRGDWNYDGTIIVKQDKPLPMNILGIYPKVTTNDKA